MPSKDNVEDIQIEHIGKVDGPRIRNLKVTNKTTNSITVEVETANAEGATYTYYYKKDGEVDWKKAEEIKEKTYTFSGLEANVIYNIKVRVEKDGKAVEKEVSTITGELPEGAVQFSPVEWKDGQASTTITTSETGYTLQYQIGGITEGSWTNTTSGSVIGNLQHEQIVYGRLFDGTNGSKTANIDVQDEILPQQATISLSGTSTNTEGNITATVTLKDNESGVNAISSRWIYNTTSGAIGENESSYTGGSFSSGQTIQLKSTTAGTYYLHVLTVDNAGNKKETISSAVTVEAALVADGNYNASKGVNTPKLGSGMTPIKWNGSSWVNTTGSDKDWYDYTSNKWANAKTSDGSMWVWIPRYAYSITSGYHSSSAGNIDVEFMKGLTNETSTGRTTFQNSSGQGNWNIHPAFNYGQTVSGIWVAKFEASRSNATSSSSGGNNTIKIQPGVSSWTDIAVNDIFKTCRNYNTLLNSHMMKNSEWGAVAYLCYSQYGNVPKINGAGSLVPNSHWYDMYTGQGPKGANDEGWYNRTDDTHNYNTANGVLASTTGNVTGIYDMSGGNWERVAGYLDNGNWSLNNYGKSADGSIKYFENGKINPAYESLWDKYEVSEEEKTNKIALGDGTTLTQGELWDWNKREEKHHEARRRVTEANYNNMAKHKGIGVNEVSTSFSFYAPYAPGTENNSQPWGWFRTPQQAMAGQQQYGGAWDNDYVLIGHSACPFVVRGGDCGDGSGAGVLGSFITFGNASDYYGFRSVLVV